MTSINNQGFHESVLFRNGTEHPRTILQHESMAKLIEILTKAGISEGLLNQIKKELHFHENPTYPDGTGNPLEDIKRLF